jgi:hypothetical protein
MSRLRAAWVTHSPVGWASDAGQMHPAVLQFDDEEYVQLGQSDRFDGEKVAREHSGGLGAQELRPGRARRPATVYREETNGPLVDLLGEGSG